MYNLHSLIQYYYNNQNLFWKKYNDSFCSTDYCLLMLHCNDYDCKKKHMDDYLCSDGIYCYINCKNNHLSTWIEYRKLVTNFLKVIYIDIRKDHERREEIGRNIETVCNPYLNKKQIFLLKQQAYAELNIYYNQFNEYLPFLTFDLSSFDVFVKRVIKEQKIFNEKNKKRCKRYGILLRR